MSLVEVDNVKKFFPLAGPLFSVKKTFVHALNGVDLHINRGEIVGLVGESGCGKSTLAKTILRFVEPSHGTVQFEGENIFEFHKEQVKKYRTNVQMIFQDVFASLNPRKKIRQIVSQAISILDSTGGSDLEEKTLEILERVGLPSKLVIDKYAHELSGGERQRVAVARAISGNPKLIVADEPASALDLSTRAQILNLIKELRTARGVSFLYISHDLAVVRSLCDRIVVMYLGKVMEQAEISELFSNPLHPYTQSLLSATPRVNPKVSRERKKQILSGEVPSPIDIPQGCPFRSRCFKAQSKCVEEPSLTGYGYDHICACWFANEK